MKILMWHHDYTRFSRQHAVCHMHLWRSERTNLPLSSETISLRWRQYFISYDSKMHILLLGDSNFIRERVLLFLEISKLPENTTTYQVYSFIFTKCHGVNSVKILHLIVDMTCFCGIFTTDVIFLLYENKNNSRIKSINQLLL